MVHHKNNCILPRNFIGVHSVSFYIQRCLLESYSLTAVSHGSMFLYKLDLYLSLQCSGVFQAGSRLTLTAECSFQTLEQAFPLILLLLLSASFHIDALYLSSQNKNNQCLFVYRESWRRLVLLKLVFKEQLNVFGFHKTYCKHKHEFFNKNYKRGPT